jgi:hypothetical protein
MATTTTGKKAAAEPAATSAVQGICSDCNDASTCTHLARNPGLVIHECENYDDSTPAKVRPAPTRTEPVYGQTKGLCMNCADRDACRFPKPEGGVWHCPEYRA